MTLLFVDGFEAQDGAQKYPNFGYSSSNTTRFGYGKSASLSSSVLAKFLPPTSQIYFGGAINMSAYVNGGFTLYGDGGTQTHISVMLSQYSLSLYANQLGTLLARTTHVFSAGAWYYVEIGATVASSGGTCVVKVDGQTLINFTGNTLNGGTNTTTDTVSFGQWNPTLNNFLYDDIYICDSNGTANNSFLGDIMVQTLQPAAVGSSTQMAPTGSVNNWQNVSDTPDVSTTYNSANSAGFRDTYTMGNLLGTTGTVLAVQDNFHGYKTDAGVGAMKAAVVSGPTLAYDTTQNLNDSNLWYADVRETDPNTSAPWAVAAVNALEFGAETA